MYRQMYILQFTFLFLLIFSECTSQDKKQYDFAQNQLQNRQPAVAGQFYPAVGIELQSTLHELFKKAEPRKTDNVVALISPHAGYVYSGIVAASSFNQIDTGRHYENVFIIGSSHRAYYEGASIYSVGDYVTPLGEVKVNTKIAHQLITGSEYFSYIPKAHISEHSIEVQLPFLQYLFDESLQIVPIVIGTQSERVCKQLASALKPYFGKNNLFVISSDFSHYPAYEEAKKWDGITADAIISNNPDHLLKSINDKTDDAVPNLVTRACGWTSLLTLMYITVGNPEFSYKKILYQNSGDTDFGDKSRVVGYNSIVVSQNIVTSSEFKLSETDKESLLQIARNTLVEYITKKEIPEIDENSLSTNLKTPCGAFVTLNKDYHLRGCIGRFAPEDPLYKLVQEMAIASATKDTRFIPVGKDELNEIEIEISVLTPMKRIESTDEIILGKHGIYINKGNRSGTFLPQVAIETGWNLEEFLGHCSQDKAGLGWNGWQEAVIYIYEAEVFSERDY
ncbi:MAG: AmmeMemoRadiSam system protein B [Bacteroidales bacterium]|nr:AmmeMemoRadiSam system protein B [Bacteroidales bacterium]